MNRQLSPGIVVLIALSACNPGIIRTESDIPTQVSPVVNTVPAPENNSIPDVRVNLATTQNNLTGNHIVDGSIDLKAAAYLDVPLDGVPVWLVSAPFEEGAVFAAVMQDGTAMGFKIAGRQYTPVEIAPARLPAGMPPTLALSEDDVRFVVPPEDASPLTNPLLLDGKLIYIASNGDLVAADQSVQTRLPVNALPDSRILTDEYDRLLVLTQPTDRYDHGVLGDALEASAIVLLESEPELRILNTIPVPEPDVIEGLSAIWADVDDDGMRDIIVTLSNERTGARIAVFRQDGSLLAESDPIGLGYRWRHQLAFAGFEPDNIPALVSLRTPHIGGIVEFLRLKDGALEVVQEIRGYSTHSIGSRNLDSGLAGDFDGNGMVELLLPDQSHSSLAVVSPGGVQFSLPLPGELTSNLAAAPVDGEIYIGVGVQDALRVWVP